MGSELRGRYRRQLTAAMAPRSYTKTYKVPCRPFESARLDSELKVVGEYGLRNKREVWRVQLTLSKIRRAARQLLTLDEKDPKRLFMFHSCGLCTVSFASVCPSAVVS